MKIGSNIKLYRKQKGLTQKQLAEKIGTTDSAITRYESDSREPSIETITKIAAALEVPVGKLIEYNTFNLTDSDAEKVDTYIDLIIGIPELKPLIPIFKNKGYELRQDMNGADIYLIKDKEPIAKIPEKDFAKFSKQMLYVINEFTDFEFSKLLDTFTFLY
ncbi:helix-turn-helix transcriptional regulator [Clostridium sp.]|uniref:helix-turn-helix domain-containing protein n=1 Tax=Clostridium sp. TaxID=1506 RepID=UPI002906A7AD|nr:helix-turn-helix transcriptional regulator [Clostridium sp.]MDU4724860.1 helix-turn-helix transcriptional regulator [Clostridium sp.]